MVERKTVWLVSFNHDFDCWQKMWKGWCTPMVKWQVSPTHSITKTWPLPNCMALNNVMVSLPLLLIDGGWNSQTHKMVASQLNVNIQFRSLYKAVGAIIFIETIPAYSIHLGFFHIYEESRVLYFSLILNAKEVYSFQPLFTYCTSFLC